jgi:hypothetical protein
MNKKDTYIIYKFVKFVKDELGIKNPFNLKLSSDRDGFKTFAYYNPSTHVIAVYIKGRALPDILRSIAHELVHHFDFQTGKAQKKQNPDVGILNTDSEKNIDVDDIENRANAIAGIMIKKFGYANSNLSIWGDKSSEQ